MKKIITLILAVNMISSLFVGVMNVGAAEISENQMKSLLSAMSIMQGDENGDFHTDDFVTRAEFAKVSVASSQWRNSVSNISRISPFPDVPYTHWGASYIRVASQNGLIKGYPDSTFRPENTVLLEEGVTIALKLLGYSDSDFGLSWPEGQMTLATRLELLDGIDKRIGDKMQRKDVMQLVFNTLNTEIKGSTAKAISAFGYNILSDTVLIATTNEDSNVAQNKIVTSAGTYKIPEQFDRSVVGLKGDLVLKNTEDIVAFFPENTKLNRYSIYTVLNNDILAYVGGQTKAIDLALDTSAYKGSQSGTVNTFLGQIKQGDSISLYSNYLGDVEYVIIGSEKLKGPYTVKSVSDLSTVYGISDSAVFMKDNKVVSKSHIQANDIIYISKEMDLVWAYSKKVTGVYESALPNKDNVTSIILSGTSYNLESSQAFNKLVTGGECELGDTITLLIGKDGSIADVITQGTSKITTYGYLIETGTKEYTRTNGDLYTSYYVKIVTADGEELEYKTQRDYKDLKSSVVSVEISDGATTVTKVNQPDINGVFDFDSLTLGTHSVSKDVKILDVLNTYAYKSPLYTTVLPKRIDGVNLGLNLASDKVLWYTKNSNGEIDTLFLNDVTGDGYSYGIVTNVANNVYTCNIAGKIQTFSGGNTVYSVGSGNPVRFTMSNSLVNSITALKEVTDNVKSFTSTEVVTENEIYSLSDKVVCYERVDVGRWQLVPLEDVLGKTSHIEFYYDKSISLGGKIRVIVSY